MFLEPYGSFLFVTGSCEYCAGTRAAAWRFTDTEEVTVFRDLVLRKADAELASRVSVADASGTSYVLLVRDELPEDCDVRQKRYCGKSN